MLVENENTQIVMPPQDIRKKYFAEINDRYHNFNDLDDISKLSFLFNSVDRFICRTTAAYINDSMLKRKLKLN